MKKLITHSITASLIFTQANLVYAKPADAPIQNTAIASNQGSLRQMFSRVVEKVTLFFESKLGNTAQEKPLQTLAEQKTTTPATNSTPNANTTLPNAPATKAESIAANQANNLGRGISAKKSDPQQMVGTKNLNRQPGSIVSKHTNPETEMNFRPIKMPSLPGQSNIAVSDVTIANDTITIYRDPLPPIKLDRKNRVQILNFARDAREMKLPAREYENLISSKTIEDKYKDVLRIEAFKPVRTALNLKLERHTKIKLPNDFVSYENMVKRIDAMFEGLDYQYGNSLQALWELSESKNNPKPLQSRDALFAGIIAQRANWKITAHNFFNQSMAKDIDIQDKYLKILWNQFDELGNINLTDHIVAKVNFQQVKEIAPKGDLANYSLAKFLANNPSKIISSKEIAARIDSKLLRERVELINLMQALREPEKRDEAISQLRNLAATGENETKEESRLALARAYLQSGKSLEALEMYKSVNRTGKNKFNVISEQIFAEYKSGMFKESLGKALGLQSPYFQYGFSPDIHIIEVLNRKATCDFGGADAGIEKFRTIYSAELAKLRELKSKDPKKFYNELIAYHEIEKPMKFERYLLQLPQVMENQKIMNEAELEIKKVSRYGYSSQFANRPKDFEKFLSANENKWREHAEKLKRQSAEAALKEGQYLESKLEKAFAQAELLDIDVATGATKNYNLQSALNFPAKNIEEAKIDREKLNWPFEQEIWEDELDYLTVKNPSKCATVASN